MINKFLLSGLLFASSLAALSSAHAMDNDEMRNASSESARSYKFSVSEDTNNRLSIKAWDLLGCCNTFDPEHILVEKELSMHPGVYSSKRKTSFSGKEGIFDTDIGRFSFSFNVSDPKDAETIDDWVIKSPSSYSALSAREKNGEFQYSFIYRKGYGAASPYDRPVLIQSFPYVLTLKKLEELGKI